MTGWGRRIMIRGNGILGGECGAREELTQNGFIISTRSISLLSSALFWELSRYV